MENKTDLKVIKEEVAKENGFKDWLDCFEVIGIHRLLHESFLDAVAKLYKEKSTEELNEEIKGWGKLVREVNEKLLASEATNEKLREENELSQKHFKALKDILIKYLKWENEDSIPPINAVVELKGFIKREEELRKENERLKNDLLDALDLKSGSGPTTLTMLKAEIERLTQSNKELVEAAKLIISKLVTYHRDNTSPSKDGYNVMVSILDRVIEKSKP